MSRQFHFKCDRCGEAELSTDPNQMIAVSIGSGAHSSNTICARCMPALAEFLPGADRSIEGLGRYASYERTVQFSSSPMRVQPEGIIDVIENPGSFRPGCLLIQDAANWEVLGLQIGNRSQMAHGTWIEGKSISEDGVKLFTEPCEDHMDLVLRVKYVGKNPEGAVFVAKIEGKSPGFPPKGAAS